ncbi:RidA family protein [Pseudomonas abyssi]|jgi:enamine deaminase RidA (YjgF/YER057c/UK114 family)|uniref:RidA family protein n=1 Tax=Pseudomonas abyssi TaxID=170540 RepID=UPI003C7B6CBF
MPDQRPTQPLQAINPPGLYDPTPNGYSHLMLTPTNVRWLFVAGQGAEDVSGRLSDDFADQLTHCLRNLQYALTAGGAHFSQVAKLTVLVVDHSEARLALISAALAKVAGDNPAPACTLIPVPRLALDGMLIEIDAVACLPASEEHRA